MRRDGPSDGPVLNYASDDRPPVLSAKLTSPWLVAATIGLLGFVGATAYAGRSAPVAIPSLVINLMYLLLWVGAALGWGAFAARWLLAGSGFGRLIGATSAYGVGLAAMGFAVLFGGLAGVVTSWFGWGVLAAGWVLGIAFVAVNRGNSKEPHRDADLDRGHGWRWLWLAAVPALACVLVAVLVPAGLLWKPSEPHGFDVVEYHFQVPREWLEAGRIVPLRHNVFSFFPFAVEMHYLLAMQVTGGAWPAMFLAQLMHAAMVAAAVAAVGGFALRFAAYRAVAIVATVAVANTPWLAQLAPIGFNEGGLLLYGVLTVGFALVGLRWLTVEAGDRTPGPWFRQFVAAGVFAGLACGVKLTAGPLLLAAVPAVLVMVAGLKSVRRAAVAAVVLSAVGAATYAPWAVRNVAWCGNPVFPEASAVFGKAHFTEAQVERWQKAHKPQKDKDDLPARLDAFRVEVLTSWQFGYVLLPLGAVALATAWRSRAARFLAGLALLHAVFWIGFTHLQGRFFVLTIPFAGLAVAFGEWDRLTPRRAVAPVLAALVVAAAVAGWFQVHGRLAGRLYGGPGGGLAAAGGVGNEDASWVADVRLRPETGGLGFPTDDPAAKLLLVGDAEAFLYPLPMSRLRYLTPFDVPTGKDGDLLSAYSGAEPRPGEWVIANVDELDRFAKTYQPFPPVPEEWRRTARGEGARTKVLRPGER